MKYFLCFIGFLSINIVHAHDANKAFFKIVEEEDTKVIVEAEFPWSIRNALIEYNPALKFARDKAEFESTLFDYLESNMVLQGNSGKNFDLISVEEYPVEGHSHQVVYRAIYNGLNLQSLSNTIMFDLYDNQKNYHVVTISEGTNYEFVTSAKFPSYIIESPETGIKLQSAFFIFILVGALGGLKMLL